MYAVIIPAHSRFEEIRRETTRGARSRMQMRDVVAHKGEIDISFSAGQDSEPEVVPAGSGTSAQRRITIWLAMTAARFAFRPTKGDAARIELYGLIQPACSPVRSRASARERGGRHAEYRAYANRPGASRLSSAQARTRVRGKRARRDRPTSADKLSAPLYKAQRRASCF